MTSPLWSLQFQYAKSRPFVQQSIYTCNGRVSVSYCPPYGCSLFPSNLFQISIHFNSPYRGNVRSYLQEFSDLCKQIGVFHRNTLATGFLAKRHFTWKKLQSEHCDDEIIEN